MEKKKMRTRIRYDEAFKQNAIKMVTEGKMQVVEAANELGIADDTLRNWLKKAGINPISESKNNHLLQKIRELEGKLKVANKDLQDKDEVIAVLKKSIGIICNP